MASSRRLSDRAHRTRSSYHPRDLARRGWKLYLSWSEQVVAAYMRLSPLYRALAALACVLGWVVIILVLVYSHRFFAWLAPYSKSWRARPGGWLLIFFLIFVTAFPPVIGYSTATTISGFIYGFPLGWPIAASACVLGSLCAFLASRTVLSGYVDRMVGRDHRFVALGQVLRHEGILYLTGIRFCPLPFSLSNGFLATIPSITPMSFAVSTALSSPKLLVHVFIGSRLAVLAEQGDSMTAGDKAINYLSMIIGGIIGILVGLAIYRRTMARAAELQREEGGAADELAAAEDGDAGYEDTEATLLDPEDAAAIMSDDDLSLWDTQGADSWGEDYHDDDITDDVQKTKKNGASD
ncbi:Tlg2-vesicle protein [Purpureocillium lilacinum]|nr:Tlg2-vesicle protein [Purpureocillium lilacinum]